MRRTQRPPKIPPMIALVFTPFEAPASAPRVFGADVFVEVASSLVLVSVELELVEVEVKVVEVVEVDVDEDAFAGASPGGKLSG